MLREEQSKSKRYREIMEGEDEVWVFNLFDGLVVLNEVNDQGQLLRAHQIPADDDPFLLNRFFQNKDHIRLCKNIHAMSVARNPPILLATTAEVEEHFRGVAEDNDWFDEEGEPDFYRAMDEAMSRQESYGQVGNQLDDMTDADGNIVSLDMKDEEEEDRSTPSKKKKGSILNRNKVSPNVIALIRRASEFTDVKDRLSTKSVQRKLGLMESNLGEQDWLFVFVHASDSTIRGLAKKRLTEQHQFDAKELSKILKEEKGYTVEVDI
jgi:hypothetical protein